MNTKTAIYAGSFDPWSFGHQFVLESALQIFDTIHVLVAINPAKKETLDPLTRTQIIANSINPFHDWLEKNQPFTLNYLSKKIHVSSTTGLVADYALEKNITHLIRGLRSTSDFEAEFNLYFSNHALNAEIQTWAIMCPPHLLHCSSTYVRSVIGQSAVKYVGTSFLSQSFMLGTSQVSGRILDMIQFASQNRFIAEPSDLNSQDLNAALQKIYNLNLTIKNSMLPEIESEMSISLSHLISNNTFFINELCATSPDNIPYQSNFVSALWSILIKGNNANLINSDFAQAVAIFNTNLGRTGLKLIDEVTVNSIAQKAAT